MHIAAAAGFLLLLQFAIAQGPPSSTAALDSDHDGLSDSLEDMLLVRFQPSFMISADDCSVKPALFAPLTPDPEPVAEDGTIYAQAFPRKGHQGEVELHFYHLWSRDCGELGHPLDAEHVSVLIRQSKRGNTEDWKALYWYAAAHEDTICDASQISRATTIDAQTHGAVIWISAGKHASFLNEELCKQGCGGDRCSEMKVSSVANLINLGEASSPMNGASWVNSPAWPLSDKLQRSDFMDVRLSRLDHLPNTDIAWANPAKRPIQAAIFGGNTGTRGAATGTRATNTALILADDKTNRALDRAAHSSGDALARSYRSVRKALDTGMKKSDVMLGNQPNN
jgi:hypothetical protein